MRRKRGEKKRKEKREEMRQDDGKEGLVRDGLRKKGKVWGNKKGERTCSRKGKG